MANATITVLEADGVTETDVIVLDVGRQAAAASKSVAASTEDKAVLDAIAAPLAVVDDWDSSDACKIVATASEVHIGEVGGRAAIVSGNFTRPSDTTAYAIGDLVANSTTAGSVTPISLTIGRGASGSAATGMIRRARLRKSGTSLTAAQFRLHLYRTSPTPSNGDNGAWLTGSVADYVGHFDFTCDKAFTNGASGNGVPAMGAEISFATQTYYGLVEARAAYTPISAEVFTVELEVIQN